MDNQKHTYTLESLFRERYKELVSSSYRICDDLPLAEDVVQQVFLKFHERNGLKLAENPPAYLRRAVVTRTLNAIRDRKKLTHPGDDALSSAVQHFNEDDPTDLSAIKAKLHLAIKNLPERARLILILSRFEGLSYKEIAAELDIAPKTVENQMSRALKLLRKSLPGALGVILALNFLSV